MMDKAKKICKAFGLFALGLVVFACGIAGGYMIGNSNSDIIYVEENSFQVSDCDENGISLTSVVVPVSEYPSMGIPSDAENAQTITATVLPNGAVNKNIRWKLRWKNEDSEWVRETGSDPSSFVKTVEDFNSYFGSEITIFCVAPFGEQIELGALADGSSEEVAAWCTCNYVKRVVSGTEVLRLVNGAGELTDTMILDTTETYAFSFDCEYSIGTCYPQSIEGAIRFVFSSDVFDCFGKEPSTDRIYVKNIVGESFFPDYSLVYLFSQFYPELEWMDYGDDFAHAIEKVDSPDFTLTFNYKTKYNGIMCSSGTFDYSFSLDVSNSGTLVKSILMSDQNIGF